MSTDLDSRLKFAIDAIAAAASKKAWRLVVFGGVDSVSLDIWPTDRRFSQVYANVCLTDEFDLPASAWIVEYRPEDGAAWATVPQMAAALESVERMREFLTANAILVNAWADLARRRNMRCPAA